MTGNGIVRNMVDCYAFIINHYEPGDRVFLIGFSRGAYTVRSLANLLMLCGVPTKAPGGPLMRYRTQVDDIAMEAVTMVLEARRRLSSRAIRRRARRAGQALGADYILRHFYTRARRAATGRAAAELWGLGARPAAIAIGWGGLVSLTPGSAR